MWIKINVFAKRICSDIFIMNGMKIKMKLCCYVDVTDK